MECNKIKGSEIKQPKFLSTLSFEKSFLTLTFSYTKPIPNWWRRFWYWFLLGWYWKTYKQYEDLINEKNKKRI